MVRQKPFSFQSSKVPADRGKLKGFMYDWFALLGGLLVLRFPKKIRIVEQVMAHRMAIHPTSQSWKFQNMCFSMFSYVFPFFGSFEVIPYDVRGSEK